MEYIDSIKNEIKHLPNRLRTRFAPSPTGYLHIGHVLSAIFVWGIAEAIEGDVLVRIEDHDRSRCRKKFVERIFEDLKWLGFLDLPSTLSPSLTQSQCQDTYFDAMNDIKRLIYSCDCSRKMIRNAMGPDQKGRELRYNNRCRQRHQTGDEFGLRCQLPSDSVAWYDICLGPQEQTPQLQCGDLLIRDKDQQWTYQFAVTVDDLNQDIDLVIRGQDLTESTARQILLARLLGRHREARFLHHPLICDQQGRKLSKRDRDTDLGELRSQGKQAEEVLGIAAHRGGIITKYRPLSTQDLKGLFQ